MSRMSKLSEYIALLWSQVGNGIYVYGGNGEDLTAMTEAKREAFYQKREVATKNSTTGKVKTSKEQNIARIRSLYDKRVKEGVSPILAFDCSGLQYWAGKKVGVITRDISADGIYGKCKKISKADVKRGDYCFTHNGKKATHVGMYVGDDVIIECQGRDVGVVTNRLSKTTAFNVFGRYPAFEADQDKEETESVEDKTSTKQPTTQKYVVVKGKVRVINGVKKYEKSVNVRSGNGKSNRSIAIVRSTQKFPLIAQEDKDPYWYRINYNGKVAWITSNSLYTEVIPCD